MKTSQSIRIVATLMIIIFMVLSYSPGVADERSDRAERRLAIMKDKLDLTDGQVNEIRAIMETARLQAERDHEKFREAGDRKGAKKAAEARQKATDEKIMALLSDRQKKEYDKLKDEMRQRKDRRGDRKGERRGGKRGGRRGIGR
jgi:Spy/CpxP family protein refolding chaperone